MPKQHKNRPKKPKQKRHPLTVIDGEQRGLEKPFGSSKKDADEMQGRREVRNATYEFRSKLATLHNLHKARLPSVLVLEITEDQESFLRDLVERGAWGDSPEAVMFTLLQETYRKAVLGGVVS